MTKLTVSEAARQWGKSRGMLYKDMNDGTLSYDIDNRNKKRIDVSEMIRMYGQPVSSVQNDENVTVTDVSDKTLPANSDTADMLATMLENITNSSQSPSSEVEALRDHIATLKEQLQQKDQQLSEKDRQLEGRNQEVLALLTQVSEMNQRLLPAPFDDDDQEDEEDDTAEPYKRKWWRFGRKVESVE